MRSEVDNMSPRISGEELKKELIAFARELGFDSCRVAACASPPHATEFRNWLREGAAGEMHYIERGEEKRCDPQKVLPGARSIIVVALNYFQGHTIRRSPASGRRGDLRRGRRTAATGKIARYAWGDDYHRPILERDHAAEAGIGWHGKSTMLINPRLGTWFVLGEILTTLDLPPDDPQPDRCGRCERCITACPTGAITAPHRLDARRCISYLTIELKGSIPLEFRPLIGNRIFGCDDCLDACPWNRFAKTSRECAFSARHATTDISLRDYLKLNDTEFAVLFRNSPIKRVKRRGFLRNVCVALGNVGDLSDLPALEDAAADPDPLIAEHAEWAIDRIQERCEMLALEVC